MRKLAGGASCEIYCFDAVLEPGADPRSLVLRMDAVGGSVEGSRSEEFALLAAAARAGVTVPAVLCCGGPEAGLGANFLIMERVRGEAIARRLLREESYGQARRLLPAQLAAELARIHAVDIEDPALGFLRRDAARSESSGIPQSGLPGGPRGDSRAYTLESVERYRGILEAVGGGRPYPSLRLAARWLEANAPAATAPALVHGDFRLGNVMFDEGGLTAVLDWELAHLGDPMEDLGWLAVRAWRFGADDKAVAGLCSREEFASFYCEAAGKPVDPDAVLYWEIYGNWKWAIICLIQTARHRAGRYPNVELATIGRRVAETEWEMLSLLEGR